MHTSELNIYIYWTEKQTIVILVWMVFCRENILNIEKVSHKIAKNKCQIELILKYTKDKKKGRDILSLKF